MKKTLLLLPILSILFVTSCSNDNTPKTDEISLPNSNETIKSSINESSVISANELFLEHFSNISHQKNIEEINDTLIKSGIILKTYAYDESNAYIGTIYTVSANGYAGKQSPIKFTISFANGKPYHYVEISHSESAQGAMFMNWLEGDTNGDRLSNLETGQVETGSSVTYLAVNKAVTTCLNDYLAEYQNIPDFAE